MKPPILFLDWNSTVQYHLHGIRQYLSKTYGAILRDEDFSEWDIDLSQKVGINRQEYLSVWSNEEVFRNSPPMPGAAQALAKLSQKYRLIILTSAACGPELCQEWFTQHKLPYSDIIWTQDKTAYDGLLIDDSPKVLEARHKAELNTVCFHQPWNRYFSDFPRLLSWRELL